MKVDLVDVLRFLWQSKLVVAVTTLLFILMGVGYLRVAPKMYRADVVLVPVDGQEATSALGALGGIAAIAGIGLQRASESQEALAVLRSRDLLREFIEENDLLHLLFARDWDYDQGVWRSSVGSTPPDLRDAVAMFDKKVRVVMEDRRNGLVTLSVTWTDANLAKEWADGLVGLVNARLRARALEESERNAAYLQQAIADTNVSAVQQALGRLLELELQKQLLAKGNSEYAFKVVDSSTIPRYPISPRPLVILSFSALSGFAFGLFAALMMRVWKSL